MARAKARSHSHSHLYISLIILLIFAALYFFFTLREEGEGVPTPYQAGDVLILSDDQIERHEALLTDSQPRIITLTPEQREMQQKLLAN